MPPGHAPDFGNLVVFEEDLEASSRVMSRPDSWPESSDIRELKNVVEARIVTTPSTR